MNFETEIKEANAIPPASSNPFQLNPKKVIVEFLCSDFKITEELEGPIAFHPNSNWTKQFEVEMSRAIALAPFVRIELCPKSRNATFCLLEALTLGVCSGVVPSCAIPKDPAQLLPHKTSIKTHTPESPKFSFDNTSRVRLERVKSGPNSTTPIPLKQFSLKSSTSSLHGI